MTVKIDNTEPNVFPVIEKIDARDSGRDAEVILATRIEGELTPVTVKLSYRQAGDLWVHWNRFGTASTQLGRAGPARSRNRHTPAFGRRRPSRQNRLLIHRRTESGERVSVVNEFVAGPPRSPTDAEKYFHLADRSSDHAVRLAGQKLVL